MCRVWIQCHGSYSGLSSGFWSEISVAAAASKSKEAYLKPLSRKPQDSCWHSRSCTGWNNWWRSEFAIEGFSRLELLPLLLYGRPLRHSLNRLHVLHLSSLWALLVTEL